MAWGFRRRIKFRGNTPASTGGGGSSSVISSSDLTYLGAYRLPQDISSIAGQSIYHMGLALRRETSDTINSVHLLSFSMTPGAAWSRLVEWRDITPEIPSSNIWDINQYSTVATYVRNYGNPFSTGSTSHRRTMDGGFGDVEVTDFLNGGQGIYWDDLSSRLYVNWSVGYQAGSSDWCMCAVDLDYGSSSATSYGPYKMAGNGGKAYGGGFCAIPPAFSTTYLGGKRLGAGFGGYRSVVGVGGACLGVSLSAIDPLPSTAQETIIPATHLLFNPVGDELARTPGYTPGRTASTSTVWSWKDICFGGAWISGAIKSGLMVPVVLGRGILNYISSNIRDEFSSYHWFIYSESQLASVALGGVDKSDVVPSIQPLVLHTVAPYSISNSILDAPEKIADILSITSNSTAYINVSTAGAIVTTVAPHGLSTSSEHNIVISGCQHSTTYENCWTAQPYDATHIRIWNTSESTTWSGLTAGQQGAINWAGESELIGGMAYDPVDQKLYLLVKHWQTAIGNDCSFVEVYSVNC